MSNRIKEHRLRRGLSQAELAKLCDTHPIEICRIETGKRRITVDWLDRLSRALGVPRTALLANAAEPLDRDFAKDDLERTILRFWRNLPEEGKDAVLLAVTGWTADANPPGIRAR